MKILNKYPLLFILPLVFCAFCLSAQLPATQQDDHVCKMGHNIAPAPPAGANIENSPSTSSAPDVSTYFDPQENGAFLYETVAGWTGGSEIKAQVSIVNYVSNHTAANITWNKVVYQYVQNGVTKTKTFNIDPIVCQPFYWFYWQNGRDYHQLGDVLYLDSPIPATLTVKLYFEGYSTPVTITKPLAPYTQTFGMPYRAYDLASNEVWEGGSTHGGGNQVFAYDMRVMGLENGAWTYYLPGTDGTQNQHSRTWGKRIYAMADGVVKEAVNNVPNNPSPGQEANWEDYLHGGGGNHFYIQHGENIALYAHMQKGSLNPALLQAGTIIHKGDFLGLAGNSGSSDAPHLHVHIRKETEIEMGPFRPLLFNTGWVIQKSGFTTLNNSANWNKLTEQGLPGLAGARAFIWPSNTKAYFSDNVYTGVWRAGTDAHALWTNASAASISSKDTELKAQGLRMTDLSVVNVGGNLLYSGVWRAGSGASTLQTGATWPVFNAQWSSLSSQGQRLLDLEIYKDANGNIRYAGVYGAGNWGHYLYINQTKAQFNALWTSLGNQGYRLVDMEVYNISGLTFYAGIWKAGSGGYALWHDTNWDSFTATCNNLSAQGLRLVDLDTDNTGASTIFSGSFLPGTDAHDLWQSSYNSIMSKWEDNSQNGLRLVDFNVRPASGSTAFADLANNDFVESSGETQDGLLLMNPGGMINHSNTDPGPFDMRVFPNPATDFIRIETESDILGWTLSNALGQVALHSENEPQSQTARIPVSDLKPGIYSLTLRTLQGDQTKQVSVTHH